jgi:exonuclease SbcD
MSDMNKSIHVVHFADAHVGMENYGRLDPITGTSTRVKDFLDRLDEVIEYALTHEADLAIFAGDAFKTRDPDPTQQREFARRIKRLTDAMPTLLVVGNHDMPGMASKASSVDIFHALDVPGVIVGHKPEGRIIETRKGPLFLAWMPYPMRNRLLSREEHQDKTIGELESALRTIVSEILHNLAHQADQHDMPHLLAGHFTVEKAYYGSERSVMLGKDVAVFASTLTDPTWDYVALGHIHRHQDLNQGGYPSVVYSGSLERIDFGEENEEKGFCWIDLKRNETKWKFIPLHSRPFRTIRVDVREETDPTQAILSALDAVATEGAVIRILVQLHSAQQAILREREIEAALKGAMSVTIGREIETETHTRLGDKGSESLTPLELIERYFHLRDERPERIEALLAKAEELIRDTA